MVGQAGLAPFGKNNRPVWVSVEVCEGLWGLVGRKKGIYAYIYGEREGEEGG